MPPGLYRLALPHRFLIPGLPLCGGAVSGYAQSVQIHLPAVPSRGRDWHRGLPVEPALPHDVRRRHISPSIFVDSTFSSLAVHSCALVLYIILGRNTISPDIYSWGLGNYILFSVFGFLIGNAINRERFERYVFSESAKELADIQRRYAYYDQMTGLKNRRAYDEKLSWLAKNAPAEFCIVSADLNGLKKANDAIGHRAGDELITGAAECLSAAFEGIDTIYRTGGDEFCVIMTGPIAKAQLCIARLEDLMSQWKGRYNSSISISTGVASNENHDSIESIVAAADQNMYEYKRNYYISQGIDRRRR